LIIKRKFLGTDKYGKSWYVSEKRSEDTTYFFVFSEESQGIDIPWEDQFILKAVVSKISKNRAIIEEFVHTYYKEKSNASMELDGILQDDVYQQLCIEEPELEVVLPNKKHGPSLSEVLAAIDLDDSSNAPNWENRGIGKLLLERVEKWARRARIRALYGFLSSRDDIEKLKKMYTKWGWRVRIFSKSQPILRGYGYAVGIVMKKLRQ